MNLYIGPSVSSNAADHQMVFIKAHRESDDRKDVYRHSNVRFHIDLHHKDRRIFIHQGASEWLIVMTRCTQLIAHWLV